jgi:benzoyl-CoA reductase/2-hydroxyglutaryl-CoA dehydratase subunit BcrC/BadD/HgdB
MFELRNLRGGLRLQPHFEPQMARPDICAIIETAGSGHKKEQDMTREIHTSQTTHPHTKTQEKQRAEMSAELERLESRPDCRQELAYFLNLFRGELSLSAIAQRVDRPIAAILCVQAPLELFRALGYHPFKIFSGSHAAGQSVAPRLPALTCPMLKSTLGAFALEAPPDCPWVIPTTCDWVVKFAEMAKLSGNATERPVYWMELPRLKDSPRAQARWYSEVETLGDFLGQSSGRKLSQKALLHSMAIFKSARQKFNRLIALRREGLVPAIWFSIIANSFFLDRIENWAVALEKALPGFRQPIAASKRIFLSGSPIFFPNFKLLHLMEESGLLVIGDDLCSSERIFPVNVAIGDNSKEGILHALAESYHQGCLCPTFGDSEHRINNIREALPDGSFNGLLFHVLKGCHPFDLEGFVLETTLKEEGLRVLRIETDYATEDSQNILTRLEAFGRTLKATEERAP